MDMEAADIRPHLEWISGAPEYMKSVKHQGVYVLNIMPIKAFQKPPIICIALFEETSQGVQLVHQFTGDIIFPEFCISYIKLPKV